MSSNDNNSIIICSKLAAGFTFKNVSMITLTNLTFIGCGNDSRSYAVLQMSQVTDANISMCKFLHSKGRVIEAAHANITMRNCSFENSSAGVIIAEFNTTMLDIGSIYTLNTFPPKISALLHINASITNFTNSRFYKNFVGSTIMIQVRSGTLTLRQCELAHNNGTRLVMSSKSSIKIFDSKLTHNFAILNMNLMLIMNTNLSINNSIFAHNVAQLSVTILRVPKQSKIESHHALSITNNTCTSCYISYIFNIQYSEVKFETFYYTNNTGSILFVHSKAIFSKLNKFQYHKQALGVHSYGRAITSIASIIRFQDTTSFSNYEGRTKGGAVYATESRVYANGDTLFYNNKAEWLGGALYLDQSDFICQQKCTFVSNSASNGGAIHAINSIITMGSDWNKFKQKEDVKSSLSFVSNSANEGGAIYLEANSKLRAPRGKGCTYELEFDNNVANHGRAIFVNDYTNIYNHPTCFIQAPSFTLNSWNGWIKINSTNENTTIHGGLLDRCIAQRK